MFVRRLALLATTLLLAATATATAAAQDDAVVSFGRGLMSATNTSVELTIGTTVVDCTANVIDGDMATDHGTWPVRISTNMAPAFDNCVANGRDPVAVSCADVFVNVTAPTVTDAPSLNLDSLDCFLVMTATCRVRVSGALAATFSNATGWLTLFRTTGLAATGSTCAATFPNGTATFENGGGTGVIFTFTPRLRILASSWFPAAPVGQPDDVAVLNGTATGTATGPVQIVTGAKVVDCTGMSFSATMHDWGGTYPVPIAGDMALLGTGFCRVTGGLTVTVTCNPRGDVLVQSATLADSTALDWSNLDCTVAVPRSTCAAALGGTLETTYNNVTQAGRIVVGATLTMTSGCVVFANGPTTMSAPGGGQVGVRWPVSLRMLAY